MERCFRNIFSQLLVLCTINGKSTLKPSRPLWLVRGPLVHVFDRWKVEGHDQCSHLSGDPPSAWGVVSSGETGRWAQPEPSSGPLEHLWPGWVSNETGASERVEIHCNLQGVWHSIILFSLILICNVHYCMYPILHYVLCITTYWPGAVLESLGPMIENNLGPPKYWL